MTVANDSDDPYEVSDVFVDGEDADAFEIASDGCSGVVLTQSNGCGMEVRFTPPEGATGSRRWWSSAPEATMLSGCWANPSSADVVFTNLGDGPAMVGPASITGSDGFVLQDGCFQVSLGPDESCFVEVAFAPKRAGRHTASLVLGGSGPASGRTVPLSGTALPQADIQIEPDSIDFGVLAAPFAAVTRQVVVRNLAGNSVSFRVQTAGFFGRALTTIRNNTCGSGPLAVGASCRLDLSVRPSRDGPFAGSLEVVSRPQLELLDSAPVTGEARGALLSHMELVVGSLLRDFARRWHVAPRATLRRRGFGMRFLANMDGSLRLTIAHAPAGSSAARTRLLARGSAPVESGEELTLRARLTRTGRKLLARPRRLRVRAQLAFSGAEVGRVVAVRDLLLRPARR